MTFLCTLPAYIRLAISFAICPTSGIIMWMNCLIPTLPLRIGAIEDTDLQFSNSSNIFCFGNFQPQGFLQFLRNKAKTLAEI